MVINDNVEVAAALPEHVGLHLGQDDTKLAQARCAAPPFKTQLRMLARQGPKAVHMFCCCQACSV